MTNPKRVLAQDKENIDIDIWAVISFERRLLFGYATP
jgi:hypothetical protein